MDFICLHLQAIVLIEWHFSFLLKNYFNKVVQPREKKYVFYDPPRTKKSVSYQKQNISFMYSRRVISIKETVKLLLRELLIPPTNY